jgi:hypothetical protein
MEEWSDYKRALGLSCGRCWLGGTVWKGMKRHGQREMSIDYVKDGGK